MYKRFCLVLHHVVKSSQVKSTMFYSRHHINKQQKLDLVKEMENLEKCAVASVPKIVVSEQSSLADEKVKISIKGLPPNTPTTLHMEITTDDNYHFTSFARFKSNSKGCVDLSRDQSYGGSYTGIDQMGLFWSLSPIESEITKYPRYHKIDVTTPMRVRLSLYDIDIASIEQLNQLEADGELRKLQLDSCVIDRWFMDRECEVERMTYKEDGFLGTLFLPPGDGPHPGVIVMFGGLPGLLEFKASLLASHGFAALALAFHGKGMDTFYPKDGKPHADLGYFKRAVDFMVNHPKVISTGVGLISISFSVHIALLMAVCFEHVLCVICINGYIWNASIVYEYQDQQFEPEDYEFFNKFSERLQSRKGVTSFVDLYPAISLEELRSYEGRGLIPFYDKKNTAYMMIAGTEDQCLPAAHYADLFRILLEDAGHPNFEVLKYNGAGHLIEPPYGALNKITRMSGEPMSWGGIKEPHAIAQEDSWFKQLKFLHRHLVARSHL